MKFSVGDVVRYAKPENLVPEFYDQWGAGPFVVVKFFEGPVILLNCSTPEGLPVTRADGAEWGFVEINLVVDPFLTAARKAIADENKNQPSDMKEVAKLERFIDGKMYSAVSSNARGREIAVVIPYGSKRGWKLFYQAVRQFARAAWPELR